MKRPQIVAEDQGKEKKAASETEQTILNLKTQIQNKKDALPDDPKAKLNVDKAIKDLEARIITLKQSLPEKKTESRMKHIVQAATTRLEMAGWFENMDPSSQKAYIKSHPNSKYAAGKGKSKPAAKSPAKPTPVAKPSKSKTQVDVNALMKTKPRDQPAINKAAADIAKEMSAETVKILMKLNSTKMSAIDKANKLKGDARNSALEKALNPMMTLVADHLGIEVTDKNKRLLERLTSMIHHKARTD